MATPSKVTMLNFFTKLPSKTSITEENPRKLAPKLNRQHVEEFQNRREQFESEVLSDNKPENVTNYLISLRSHSHEPFRIGKRACGSMRARLLQFCEDVRPPYYGTWQKKSKLVTGRKPFGQDNDAFDYDVDSEAEWDLGGPGESLKGDDSEDDDDPLDDYEIDMKTFVPHGYVSDDEVDVHSDSEENRANRSMDEAPSHNDTNNDEETDDTNSSVKIIGEKNVKSKPVEQQHDTPVQQEAKPPPRPKVEIKPISVGLNYEGNPTLSEGKIQFLKAFQGVSCN